MSFMDRMRLQINRGGDVYEYAIHTRKYFVLNEWWCILYVIHCSCTHTTPYMVTQVITIVM